MLVLSRKAGQKVYVGDDIVLEVRRVAGNRVTIALEAPKDVRILRGELKQAATEFEIDINEESLDGPSRDNPRIAPKLAGVLAGVPTGEMVG